jgi:tetratricopeptide (TPR) repeat protein
MRKLLTARPVIGLCIAMTMVLVSTGIQGQAQRDNKASTTQSAVAGPNGTAINAGRDVSYTVNNISGITLEQYEAGLKRREKEVREELSKASVQDKQNIALLQRQLADLQARREDPAKSLAEYKTKLAQAYQEIEKLKGTASPDEIAQAKAALAKGDTSAAEALFRQVYDKGMAQAAEGMGQAAESAFQLGALAEARIDYATAQKYFGDALRLRPDGAGYLRAAAGIADTLGQYAKAETLYLQALEIDKKSLGAEHPDVAIGLNNLAQVYYQQGQYAKAAPLYLQALEINKKALGPEHRDVATNLNNLALLYKVQGQYARAEPLYLQALEIDKKVVGPAHPDVARDLNNLAELYKAQGQYAKAEPLLLQALEIDKKALGPEHPDVAIDLNNLAHLYKVQGQYAKAETLYLQALEIDKKSLGPEHPDVAIGLNNLAELYDAQGEYAKAEPLYRQALAILQNTLPVDHPSVATILENYADCLAKLGRGDDSKRIAREAAEIRSRLAATNMHTQ